MTFEGNLIYVVCVLVQTLWKGVCIPRCSWQSREKDACARATVYMPSLWKIILTTVWTEVSHGYSPLKDIHLWSFRWIFTLDGYSPLKFHVDIHLRRIFTSEVSRGYSSLKFQVDIYLKFKVDIHFWSFTWIFTPINMSRTWLCYRLVIYTEWKMSCVCVSYI